MEAQKPEPAPPPPVRERAQHLLAHVRYVFGYLASGFLISVPLSATSHLIGTGGSIPDTVVRSLVSIGYGLVCLVPFFALGPFAKVDWKTMTVPRYQLFDMLVTRSATIVSGLLCVLSLQLQVFVSWVEPRVFWTVFVLILFSWARLKALTLLYPEFYREGS